jgi:integrase
LDRGYITVTQTKTGKDRKIPFSRTLKQNLRELHKNRQSDYVFANPDTQKPYADLKKSFAEVLRRAKVTGFRFHDLRHTAATRMVASGIDLIVVQDILGHACISTTMRYSHPVPERKLQAVMALDSYVAGHQPAPGTQGCRYPSAVVLPLWSVSPSAKSPRRFSR